MEQYTAGHADLLTRTRNLQFRWATTNSKIKPVISQISHEVKYKWNIAISFDIFCPQIPQTSSSYNILLNSTKWKIKNEKNWKATWQDKHKNQERHEIWSRCLLPAKSFLISFRIPASAKRTEKFLSSSPFCVIFCGDSRELFIERDRRLTIIHNKSLNETSKLKSIFHSQTNERKCFCVLAFSFLPNLSALTLFAIKGEYFWMENSWMERIKSF